MITTPKEYYAALAVFAGSFVVTYIIMRKYSRADSRGRPPPSIGSVPLLGSIPYLPSFDVAHRYFLDKSYELGPVISMQIGGSYTVMLNSYEALHDAYIKRATDFASRPFLNFNKYFNPYYKGISDRFYDADFKKYQHLSMSVLKKLGYGSNVMEVRINMEVEVLLAKLKELKGASCEAGQHINTAIQDVITSILFGCRLSESEADMAVMKDIIQKMFYDSAALVPLEFIPALKYVPRYGNVLNVILASNAAMFKLIDEKIAENSKADAEECFVSCYLKECGNELDKEQLAYTVRDFVLAGYETSATAIKWAVVLLANNPDAQKKAQDAIDAVISRDRQPSMSDKTKLPYIEALIMEVMRRKTPVPMGLPRATLCDTEVLGYSVPKGATVVPNLYAAHMNKDIWHDPEEFKPERFLDSSGKIFNRELVIPFSIGKRSCLGEMLARQELFLIITGLLQSFQLLPPEGQQSIDEEEILTAVMCPKAFSVRLVER